MRDERGACTILDSLNADLHAKTIRRLAGVEGLEPPTLGLEIRCSIRLSYTPARIMAMIAAAHASVNCQRGCTHRHQLPMRERARAARSGNTSRPDGHARLLLLPLPMPLRAACAAGLPSILQVVSLPFFRKSAVCGLQ